jgi:hypothetical protein
MYNTVEYSYETGTRHLTDDEALETFKRAKQSNPDAIVVMDDLSCGHWDVDVYTTDSQKKSYYRKRVDRLYNQLMSKLTK